MPDLLHVVGIWPDPLTIRRGWAKAVARPWNDDIQDATVRLERGSSDFLQVVAEHLASLGSGTVYSPALYPSATRVWNRAGFARFTGLDVMERALGAESPMPEHRVEASADPDWAAVVGVDRLAFDGFWRMSAAGLLEAMRATPRSVLLQASVDDRMAGYALAGAQMGLSFLQRVAVAPALSGRGIGTSLVRGALAWAGGNGARVMVLNLKPGNHKARDLYERQGFRGTGTTLQLLRFEV